MVPVTCASDPVRGPRRGVESWLSGADWIRSPSVVPSTTDGSRGHRPICTRLPHQDDGTALWALARANGLDENSPYAYLMWAEYFAATSIVGEVDDTLVGFVTGFAVPARPDTLFVWQVGVDEAQRGRGIGSQLLDALVRRHPHVRYLEATVTPTNSASAALFRGFGDRHGASVDERELFGAHLFPAGHEAEVLFRIGPVEGASTT